MGGYTRSEAVKNLVADDKHCRGLMSLRAIAAAAAVLDFIFVESSSAFQRPIRKSVRGVIKVLRVEGVGLLQERGVGEGLRLLTQGSVA